MTKFMLAFSLLNCHIIIDELNIYVKVIYFEMSKFNIDTLGNSNCLFCFRCSVSIMVEYYQYLQWRKSIPAMLVNYGVLMCHTESETFQ